MSLADRLKTVLLSISSKHGEAIWNKLTDLISTNFPYCPDEYQPINSIEFMEAFINLPHWNEIFESILEEIMEKDKYLLISILMTCKMSQEIQSLKMSREKEENANKNNNNNNKKNDKKKTKKRKKRDNNNNNNNNNNKKKKKKKRDNNNNKKNNKKRKFEPSNEENQPLHPSKKIKLSQNLALVLISQNMHEMNVNDFCNHLLDADFQYLQHKHWTMNQDKLCELFCTHSNQIYDTMDILQTGMITEFENNEKNRVLVITHKTKPVLERLNELIKEQKRGYDDQHEGSDNNIYHYMNTNQVYITLSDNDVKCKYNLLFDELEIHDVFWNKMKRHSPLFIASNHSFSIETNLNEFYDNTKNKIQLAQKYQNTKCCCHPIVTSLDLESHSTLNIQCIDVIDKTVINAASR